jgi:hypothetical protein
MTDHQHQQLVEIDTRRAEIEATLASMPNHTSYQASELLTEDAQLRQRRRVIENRIFVAPVNVRARERDKAFLRADIERRKPALGRDRSAAVLGDVEEPASQTGPARGERDRLAAGCVGIRLPLEG